MLHPHNRNATAAVASNVSLFVWVSLCFLHTTATTIPGILLKSNTYPIPSLPGQGTLRGICPIRLRASGVGLSGGCKAGLALKERYLLAAACGRENYSWQ